MDTDGRLLAVNLTTADISDSAGAQPILDAIRKRWPWVKHFFADGAYDRRTLLDKAAFLDFVVEVVRRTDTDPGFKVIPRRWVVERSFGWLTRYRRRLCERSESNPALLQLADDRSSQSRTF
ncbi:MAG: family transposase [Rhodospirillales bacterium]|nr:family transposase [Rhodospirillales bacterium]